MSKYDGCQGLEIGKGGVIAEWKRKHDGAEFRLIGIRTGNQEVDYKYQLETRELDPLGEQRWCTVLYEDEALTEKGIDEWLHALTSGVAVMAGICEQWKNKFNEFLSMENKRNEETSERNAVLERQNQELTARLEKMKEHL